MFDFLRGDQIREINYLRGITSEQENLLHEYYIKNVELRKSQERYVNNEEFYKAKINRINREIESLTLKYSGLIIHNGNEE